jgi:Family of unknown function (DUF6496)
MKKKMDHKLMKSIKEAQGKKKHKKKYSSDAESKVSKVMHEFGEGKLHSGSKKGPVVKNRKQAVAIGISEARKRGMKVPKKKK